MIVVLIGKSAKAVDFRRWRWATGHFRRAPRHFVKLVLYACDTRRPKGTVYDDRVVSRIGDSAGPALGELAQRGCYWGNFPSLAENLHARACRLGGRTLCFMSYVFVEVFSNTTDVVRSGTRWEPVGNPLGTRWEPGSRRGFAAGRRLLAGCAPGRDLVNSPAVDEPICSASLK